MTDEFKGHKSKSEMKRMEILKFPHYWICSHCAKERGGVWPKDHVATLAEIKCEYCDDKYRVGPSAPYVDYDWPNDKRSKVQKRLQRD